MGVSVGYGMHCPRCNISIGATVAVGSDASRCPNCGGVMRPDEDAQVFANVACKNCGTSVGLSVGSAACPNCGTPWG